MHFTRKVRKAFRWETYAHGSARRAARRLLWYFGDTPARLRRAVAARRDGWSRRVLADRKRRLSSPERLLEGINAAELARVRRMYADGQVSPWTKYLEVEKWLALNVRYARELGLVTDPPRDVLDLGCGGGFFLYVCRRLGARVQGLDLEGDPIFDALVRLFDVPRLGAAVRRGVRLPDFGGRKFDLITAWMICFNDFSREDDIWRGADWAFLIDDLCERLTPDGRIVFSLNKQPDGKYYSEEIGQVFAARAGRTDGKRIVFTKAGLDVVKAAALHDLAAPKGGSGGEDAPSPPCPAAFEGAG